ncbi:MAG: hypothetical protein A2Y80_10645 [Deltaproteobacteria bacterium RBG_13_58_19]|nr:MAG: hypothetical protein A2Y80_10645 [Deltaproteobacteria bacterium RBG_13_58_19]
MKIEDLLLLTTLGPARPETKGTGEDKFAQHLEEALAQIQKDPATKELVETAATLAPQLASEVGNSANELLNTALSRLEIFQEALGRPEISLKTLSPLAQALEQDSRRLQSAAQNLPSSSPVRQLVDETAALAYTESFKFNRGDFI